ncbi:hypothetical protein Vadar_022613 [Vaccinium darrowii]|uniref:Uncharacterized protein n=1 Tax=Vaccinium darrowii TaxID=229202 RepID=A0ACB7Z5K8_9ERIC|nr:hypothetical protein Vadar_022613 [Vaccinium darrowii]
MQGLVEELWHTRAPMRVVGRHDNFYLFRFYSEVDFNHAFLRGPWSMRGGLMVMDVWQPGMSLAVTRINRAAVWVQLYKLPLECFCEEAGLRLGGMLGDVLRVDIRHGTPCNIRYLSGRVMLDLEKPLVSGISLRRQKPLVSDISLGWPNRPNLWVRCKYERIYKVCRACGLVGHTLPQCGDSRKEAKMRIDDHLCEICQRHGTQMVVNNNLPMYNSNVRAYAHNDRRRNTHLWVDGGEQMHSTEVLHGNQDLVGIQSNEVEEVNQLFQGMQINEAVAGSQLMRGTRDMVGSEVRVNNFLDDEGSSQTPWASHVAEPQNSGLHSSRRGRDQNGGNKIGDKGKGESIAQDSKSDSETDEKVEFLQPCKRRQLSGDETVGCSHWVQGNVREVQKGERSEHGQRMRWRLSSVKGFFSFFGHVAGGGRKSKGRKMRHRSRSRRGCLMGWGGRVLLCEGRFKRVNLKRKGLLRE